MNKNQIILILMILLITCIVGLILQHYTIENYKFALERKEEIIVSLLRELYLNY